MLGMSKTPKAKARTDPSTISSSGNGPCDAPLSPGERALLGPHPAGPGREELRVRPCKHRLIQVTRTPNRKLFDAARREVFLEWFAATCNVRLAAAKAEINYQTVFKHRMKDEAFAAAWDRALVQGYAYLEARLLQEAMNVDQSGTLIEDSPSTIPSAGNGPPPHPAKPGREEPSEDEVERHFDPDLAITLLREHARRLPGSADKRKHFRPAARVASNAEVKEALVKRLAAYGKRVSKGPGADVEGPLHHPSDGPPPRPGEE